MYFNENKRLIQIAHNYTMQLEKYLKSQYNFIRNELICTVIWQESTCEFTLLIEIGNELETSLQIISIISTFSW